MSKDEETLKALHRPPNCGCPVCSTAKFLDEKVKVSAPLNRSGNITLRVLTHLFAMQLARLDRENRDRAIRVLADDLTIINQRLRESEAKPKN